MQEILTKEQCGSSASVTVNIIDVNDNSPQILNQTLNFTVMENQTAPVFLGKVIFNTANYVYHDNMNIVWSYGTRLICKSFMQLYSRICKDLMVSFISSSRVKTVASISFKLELRDIYTLQIYFHFMFNLFNSCYIRTEFNHDK